MTCPSETKNWTRLLGQPCPECGFDGASVPRDDIGPRLRQAAMAWEALLGDPLVRVRPSTQVWSPLEHGCHVRDLLVLFRYRVRLTRYRTEPRYAKWDEVEAAVRERYGDQDPARVAREIVEAARRVAEDFESLGDGDWERSGRRTDGVQLTVETLGHYLLHELTHHAADARRGTTLASKQAG